MRKLIIASLMLLGLAVSASGQYRIVKLNSSQVQGQEPKADSITIVWDDGEDRHRLSSILPQGPLQFFTEGGPPNRPGAQVPFLIVDTTSKDRSVPYLRPGGESADFGEVLLGYQTILLAGHSVLYDTEGSQSLIHYSQELGTDLKIVTTRGDMVSTSEAVSIDQQANFDPRTVDLSAVEKAAARAEAAGQGEYAKEIRRLVRRCQR